MIKLFLMFCFYLSFLSITKAQTQDNSNATEQETKDWIISKFNAYSKGCAISLPHKGFGYFEESFQNFRFYFDSCNFIIEYDYDHITHFDDGTTIYTDSWHAKYILPIYAIDLVDDGGYFQGNQSSEIEIKQTTDLAFKYNQTQHRDQGGFKGDYQTNYSYFELSWSGGTNCRAITDILRQTDMPAYSLINWQGEANLFTRMQTAFNHLKKFCHQPSYINKF